MKPSARRDGGLFADIFRFNLERTIIMDNRNLIGMTIVFEDQTDGTEKYGRIEHVSGDDGVIHLISKEKAGPHPRRVKFRSKSTIRETSN